MFLAVVRRRDRHRRAPGGANVDGLQAVAPHPPGQVAHEGARRVANRGGAHRALQHGGEEGAEELVRDGPQLLFALLRFLCRPGRWSTRLKLQRPPEGSAQVDGNVRRSLSRLGVSMALLSIQRTIMGSPSRNVQYHPPRLSEDRLNLPQPHSPSLPTHCSGKSGMRPFRFDALAAYTRSPYISLSASELGWFEEADGKVLGIVSLDVVDRDYVWTVLARDAKNRYRAVDLQHSIPTQAQAQEELARALAHHALQPAEEHHQGDEVGPPVDFFAPVVPDRRQHQNFTILLNDRHSPARDLIRELMHHFADVDGNFVEQFQSTGFDARLWELYLFALFAELAYGLDREHASPDFHCVGLRGDFFVEATTVINLDVS